MPPGRRLRVSLRATWSSGSSLPGVSLGATWSSPKPPRVSSGNWNTFAVRAMGPRWLVYRCRVLPVAASGPWNVEGSGFWRPLWRQLVQDVAVLEFCFARRCSAMIAQAAEASLITSSHEVAHYGPRSGSELRLCVCSNSGSRFAARSRSSWLQTAINSPFGPAVCEAPLALSASFAPLVR